MRQIYFIIVCLLSINVYGQENSWKYFGQEPPEDIPQVFAKGIISTKHFEHSSPAFSPDLKEVFWSIICKENLESGNYNHTIFHLVFKNGNWSKPDTAFFSGPTNDDVPMFSPNGKRLYFSRNFSDTLIIEDWSLNNNLDIFFIEKNKNGWEEPVNIGKEINTNKAEWQATISKNYNIYFENYLKGVKNNSGIFCSEFKNNKYQKPYPLPKSINSEEYDRTPFIAPDESYIIFSSSRNPENNGNGYGDLYISFKINNKWSKAIYMGNKINTKERERFPTVSPDGEYLFFKRYNNKTYGDIMWVDAKIIEELRKKVYNKTKMIRRFNLNNSQTLF